MTLFNFDTNTVLATHQMVAHNTPDKKKTIV